MQVLHSLTCDLPDANNSVPFVFQVGPIWVRVDHVVQHESAPSFWFYLGVVALHVFFTQTNHRPVPSRGFRTGVHKERVVSHWYAQLHVATWSATNPDDRIQKAGSTKRLIEYRLSVMGDMPIKMHVESSFIAE